MYKRVYTQTSTPQISDMTDAVRRARDSAEERVVTLEERIDASPPLTPSPLPFPYSCHLLFFPSDLLLIRIYIVPRRERSHDGQSLTVPQLPSFLCQSLITTKRSQRTSRTSIITTSNSKRVFTVALFTLQLMEKNRFRCAECGTSAEDATRREQFYRDEIARLKVEIGELEDAVKEGTATAQRLKQVCGTALPLLFTFLISNNKCVEQRLGVFFWIPQLPSTYLFHHPKNPICTKQFLLQKKI